MLEVGMYIRHSGLDGDFPIIQKIIELREPGRCGGKYKVFTDKTNGWFIDSDYIEIEKSKYSFNIIDLIEVGDYVNGCMVINKKDDTIQIIQLIIPFDLKEKDIKSIVTKEMFANAEYKVGE